MRHIKFRAIACIQTTKLRLEFFEVAKIASSIDNFEPINSLDALIPSIKNIQNNDIIFIEHNVDNELFNDAVKYIRYGHDFLQWQRPIIAVGNEWTDLSIAQLRDSGVCDFITLPTSIKVFTDKIVSVLNNTRQFIMTESFRGRCRRRNKNTSYYGPFRRETDGKINDQTDDDSIIGQQKNYIIKRIIDRKTPHHYNDDNEINIVNTLNQVVSDTNISRLKCEIKAAVADGFLFDWPSVAITGNKKIDHQHSQLFTYLADLKNAADSDDEIDERQIKLVFERLLDYTAVHFADEELIMDSFEYDEREKHKRSHYRFVNKVKSIVATKITRDMTTNVVIFLYNWLANHIATTDRVMVAKYNNRKNSGDFQSSSLIQTSKVIGRTLEVAGQCEQIAIKINKSKSHDKRSMSKFVTSSDRLINLLMPAQERVAMYGCLTEDQENLSNIMMAVRRTCASLININVEKAISDISVIDMSLPKIPIGISMKTKSAIERIETLVRIIGGTNNLHYDIADKISQLHEMLQRAIAIEEAVGCLRNYE